MSEQRRKFDIEVGGMRESVSGRVFGPLGVHRTTTGWRISHLPTGRRVSGDEDFLDKKDALSVANALKNEDWSGSPSAIRRRLRSKVRAALATIPDGRKVPAGAP